MLGEPDTACDRRPEVNTGALDARGMKSEPVFPSRFLSFSNAAVLRSSLIAKELCLSGAVGDVICSASEVDDRSLDVFISPPALFIHLDEKKVWGGAKEAGGRAAHEGKLHTDA